MVSPNFFIDIFQSTKKGVFKQIVSNPELQRVADRYVDAQTEFAKMLVTNTIDIAKFSLDIICSKKEQASQAPYKVDKEAN
jgi:hypothetical protein